jgi:hypothetical protein
MKVYAARSEDVQQGVVWVHRPGMPPRCVLRIKNPSGGKSIYCEAMAIDENFLRAYNQSPRISIAAPGDDCIVMAAWHRSLLGSVQTGQDVDLRLEECNTLWSKLRACLDHPQTVVRVGAWLGAIGLALGVIGFGLSLWSIWLTYNPPGAVNPVSVQTPAMGR